MKQTEENKRRKGTPASILSTLSIIIAACLLFYPMASEIWNASRNSGVENSFSSAVQSLSGEDYSSCIDEAKAYNEGLTGNAGRFDLDGDRMQEYMALLNPTGSGMMGTVEIPVIGVKLPLYHTVESTVLQVACGHIPGSSLPVGGESTHSAISGHTGMSSSKLFTDLTELSVGDIFTLRILGETLDYEVETINIVEPEDLSLLEIQPGRDLCTLITCTPLGLNTHRLLVTGHRIGDTSPVQEDGNQMNPSPAMKKVSVFSKYELIFAGAGVVLIALAVFLPVLRRRADERKEPDIEDCSGKSRYKHVDSKNGNHVRQRSEEER